MYAYLKGVLAQAGPDYIILDVNDIGYRVHLPASAFRELPSIGEKVQVHTYLYVKEDALTLFGFLSEAQRQLFTLLLTVSGIGPKGALGIVSASTVEDFLLAVATENISLLTGVPGIGKKTAQRLILELKEKVHGIIEESYLQEGKEKLHDSNKSEEAAAALITLGYQPAQVRQVMRSMPKEFIEESSVEELIRYGLKQLANYRG